MSYKDIKRRRESCRKYYKNNIEKERERSILKNIYRKNNEPWKFVLQDIKQRCNNPKNKSYKYYGKRGIECRITDQELKDIWFRDKAYEMEKPSIDRIDNDGHYQFDNCRFIEMSENIGKRNKNHKITKPILQYDLDGNFIREWKSVISASKELKINYSGISNCARGAYRTSSGFIWRYKDE